MKIVSSKDRPSRKASPNWFTGAVWVDEIVVNPEPSHLRAFRVSFSPGARTNWHTHPLGQTLHVLTGHGLVQLEGESIRQKFIPATQSALRRMSAIGTAQRQITPSCIWPCRRQMQRA